MTLTIGIANSMTAGGVFAQFQRLQQIIFDDFNRLDANPIDGSWATVVDFDATQIVNGMVKATSNAPGSSMSYRTDATPANGNQWAECDIGAGQTVGYQGVMLRNMNADGGTFYVAWAFDSTHVEIWRWLDGTGVELDSITVPTIVPGDTLRLEVEGPDCGPRLSAFINDSQVGTTLIDTVTPIIGTGTWATHTLGLGSFSLDNFRAGNILYEGATPPTFDATGSDKAENGTATVSWQHDMGTGTSGIVLTWVGWDSTTESITDVTYDGTSMTELPGGSLEAGNRSSGSWYFTLAPASGSKTVEVTLSGGSHFGLIGQSVSFTGVNQTTPIEEINNSISTSTSVSTCALPKGAATIIVDGLCAVFNGVAVTATAGSNQTDRANDLSSFCTAAISTEPALVYDGTTWTLGDARDSVNIAFTLRGL